MNKKFFFIRRHFLSIFTLILLSLSPLSALCPFFCSIPKIEFKPLFKVVRGREKAPQVKWSYPCYGSTWSVEPPMALSIVGFPVVGRETVYIVSPKYEVVALSKESGVCKWKKRLGKIGDFFERVIIEEVGNDVYIGASCGVFSLSVATGKVNWIYRERGIIWMVEGIIGNLICLVGQDRLLWLNCFTGRVVKELRVEGGSWVYPGKERIYVCNKKNQRLKCFDKKTAKKLWVIPIPVKLPREEYKRERNKVYLKWTLWERKGKVCISFETPQSEDIYINYNGKTGKMLWIKRGNYALLFVKENIYYFCPYNPINIARKKGVVFDTIEAIDGEDGKLVKKIKIRGVESWSKYFCTKELFIYSHKRKRYGVSWESGEEKWSSRLYEPYPRTTLHYSGDLRKVIGNIYLSIFQLPPEDEDEHWWVKWFNFPTYLSAFEIATGKLLWQLESRNLICPPIAVSDNMIYVRVVGLRKHHGVVYALELQK